MPSLTATAVKQAKPQDKQYKMTEGGGMYLLIKPSEGKYWRYNYRFVGKRKTLALGTFPEISLADARKRHIAARELLARHVDPGEQKKIEKLMLHLSSAESFEALGREWFAQNMDGKSKSYHDRTLRILEKDLYPVIGNRSIASISAPELLAALRRIEARGAVDIAHRAKQTSSLIFRYAVATGRAERDPSQDLTGALKNRRKKHYAAITDPKEVGRLMVSIGAFQGTVVVKTVLQLSPLLFQRPGEIRNMEWSEINWQNAAGNCLPRR
jgi:hypothetical protein